MNRRIPILAIPLLCLTALACSKQAETPILVKVASAETGKALDSVRLYVFRGAGGGSFTLWDSTLQNDTAWLRLSLPASQGYTYRLRAERTYYKPPVSVDGSRYLNEVSFIPKETDSFRLLLAPILAPAIQDIAQAAKTLTVHEVIAQLKANTWEGQYLPRLGWEDIPPLLEVATDTTYLDHFPTRTNNPYRVKQARMGLVALWIVEAIRQDVRKRGNQAGFLIPASKVPVLGTRRGNPALRNRTQTVQVAADAYNRWWETVKELDPAKGARKVPLRGTGYGWM